MIGIVVLMSTYNGEKYIKTQLDSILQQSVKPHVLIRDDGSIDATVEIIEEYINSGEDVELIRGENLGVKASFFELIKMAPEADYYAFADQDDYWLANKLERAIFLLEAEDSKSPLLYCSDTYLVDDDLQVIKREDRKPRPSFGNALVENICTGCTAVFNRALLETVRNNMPNTERIVMHDWWLYLIAETYGKTVFDNEPQIYYRQHGNNEWGIKTTKTQILKYRFRQLFARRGYIFRQLEELKCCLGDLILSSEKTNMLNKVLQAENSFVGRIKLLSDRRIYKGLPDDDRVYRMAMLVGKL